RSITVKGAHDIRIGRVRCEAIMIVESVGGVGGVGRRNKVLGGTYTGSREEVSFRKEAPPSQSDGLDILAVCRVNDGRRWHPGVKHAPGEAKEQYGRHHDCRNEKQ